MLLQQRRQRSNYYGHHVEERQMLRWNIHRRRVCVIITEEEAPCVTVAGAAASSPTDRAATDAFCMDVIRCSRWVNVCLDNEATSMHFAQSVDRSRIVMLIHPHKSIIQCIQSNFSGSDFIHCQNSTLVYHVKTANQYHQWQIIGWNAFHYDIVSFSF